MKRPRPEPALDAVCVRLTWAQGADLSRVASAAGLSRTEWARRVLLREIARDLARPRSKNWTDPTE